MDAATVALLSGAGGALVTGGVVAAVAGYLKAKTSRVIVDTDIAKTKAASDAERTKEELAAEIERKRALAAAEVDRKKAETSALIADARLDDTVRTLLEGMNDRMSVAERKADKAEAAVEACESGRELDRKDLAECKIAHAASGVVIDGLQSDVHTLSGKLIGLQRVMRISDEQMRSFTPMDFPAVKPPTTG